MTIQEANNAYAGKVLTYEDKEPKYIIVRFEQDCTILKGIDSERPFQTSVNILNHLIREEWFALPNNNYNYEIY